MSRPRRPAELRGRHPGFHPAKGHERDVLSGLRGGAVDYVVKPFSLKELAARVELALSKE
ncbi:MAG TPA: hypothetical protein VE420_00945 [Gemmatimonadales bacterium]|jgi:DNA-binding response OmpR family regulator|nr:hypothetical protein [Gemmatimonadales bacterium]